MLGRLMHYGIDAVLFSTLLAGVKRHSGYQLDLSRVSDDTTRSIAEKYMGVGEFVFDSTVAAAHASALFRRGSPLDDKTHGAAQEAIGAAREKKEAWFK